MLEFDGMPISMGDWPDDGNGEVHEIRDPVEVGFYLLFPFFIRDLQSTWGWKLILSLLPAIALIAFCILLDPPYLMRITLALLPLVCSTRILWPDCLNLSSA